MAEVRPIDANALELSIRKTGQCERCENQCLHRVSISKWDMHCKVIEQAPTIDYEPVIHAYWMDGAYCSNCRASKPKPCAAYLEPKANTRCHVCGAKMDLKS